MRTQTNQANILIACLQEFKTGGSLKGEWSYGGTYYSVDSYDTLIARFVPLTKTVYLNTAKYSQTTSRHQAEVRRAISEFQAVTFHGEKLSEWTVLPFDGWRDFATRYLNGGNN